MNLEVIKLITKGGAISAICLIASYLTYFVTNVVYQKMDDGVVWQKKTYEIMVETKNEMQRHNEQMLQLMRRADLRAGIQ